MSKQIEKESNKSTNVILFGTNFLAAQIFVALCSFTDINITVIDRKDPYILQTFNRDVFNIFNRYLPGVTTRDFYNAKIFGDKPSNRTISLVFKDWVNEDIEMYISDSDIIINAGGIYDSQYAKNNPKDTLFVSTQGLYNLLKQVQKNSFPYKSNGNKRPLFIQMSSVNVYGDQSGDQTPLEDKPEITEENTTPNPIDILNLSLYQQENMVKSFFGGRKDSEEDLGSNDIDYLILRLGTLCGDFTPPTSLITAACLALLEKKKTFTVYDGSNSIEPLHINDLFHLMMSLIKRYRAVYHDNQDEDGNIKVDKEKEYEYLRVVNQIYNIKADEKEEKTVQGVVNSIYAMTSYLPAVKPEHKIGRLRNYKIQAPKIVKGNDDSIPFIKFGRPISSKKAYDNLGFLSGESLSYVYRHVLRYCLNYLTPDISDTEKEAICKIFYIPVTPNSENIKGKKLKTEIKDLVRKSDKIMSKALSEPNEPVMEENDDQDEN